jgi:hypothetical protein
LICIKVLTVEYRHDGGTNAKIYVNGKLACVSNAIYGGESKAVNGEKWDTITAYGDCKDPIKVSVADKLTMSVEYDLTKYRLYVYRSTMSLPVLTYV